MFFSNDSTVVKTDKGLIKGYKHDDLYEFKGITYAKARRFQKPQEIEKWDGIVDATSYGYVCPLMEVGKPNGEIQVPHRYWPMNEDCLNLNIWTKGLDDKKRPVMFWMHGGGFEAGSSIEQLAYEGGNMAKLGDVVVVSVNHRLNILGYFDLSEFGEEYENSGNRGTEDLIMALKWVKNNIANFGGNPDNVTIFGQSGGGTKVTTLLQTPEADGLYHRGINMSGVIDGILPDSIDSRTDVAKAMMKVLNIKTIKELEEVSFNDLVKAYNAVKPEFVAKGKELTFTPHRNKHYFGNPNQVGFRKETSHIPLIAGSVFGEFGAFLPTPYNRNKLSETEQIEIIKGIFKDDADKAIELFKKAYPKRPIIDVCNLDFIFRMPNIAYNLRRGALNSCTYNYIFNLDFPINDGAIPWHCSDIPYIFHNVDLIPVCQNGEASLRLEKEIFNSVMAFAKTGNPNYGEFNKWTPTNENLESVVIFGEETETKQNHDHELVGLVAKYLGPVFANIFGNKEANIQH